LDYVETSISDSKFFTWSTSNLIYSKYIKNNKENY
jgi:hypothetical protein